VQLCGVAIGLPHLSIVTEWFVVFSPLPQGGEALGVRGGRLPSLDPSPQGERGEKIQANRIPL